MTPLFRDDAYLKTCQTAVTAADAEGIRLDRTVFYPAGGGQPGDRGVLRWSGGETPIADTVKGEGQGDIVHVPEPGAPLPPPGTEVDAVLDWPRRYRHMRMHTAMHLLCAVVDGDVTGGQVGADRSRLDFNVPPGVLDKQRIADAINALVVAGHAVSQRWIDDAEMTRRPDLVRTMSVKPPTGTGKVRLLQIGADADPVDLQPCGGTHVANTAEVGPITVAKIENKGRQNRRVVIALADGPAS